MRKFQIRNKETATHHQLGVPGLCVMISDRHSSVLAARAEEAKPSQLSAEIQEQMCCENSRIKILIKDIPMEQQPPSPNTIPAAGGTPCPRTLPLQSQSL